MGGSGTIEELARQLEANIEPALSHFEAEIQQLRRELKAATESLAASFVASASPQNGSAPGSTMAALKAATVTVQQQISQPNALQALADQAAHFAPRVVLLVIKGTNALGWIGHGFVDSITGGLRNLMVPLSSDSIIREVVRTQASLMSSPTKYSESNVLFERLGKITPKSIAAVPLMVRGKVAGVLYGDSGQTGEICLEALEMLTSTCGLALEIILLGGRKDSSPPSAQPFSPASLSTSQPMPSSQSIGSPQPVSAPQPVPQFISSSQPIPLPVPQFASSPEPVPPPLSAPAPKAKKPVTAARSRFDLPVPANGRPPSASSIFGQSSSAPFDPSTIADTGETKSTSEVDEARRIARLLVQELVLYNQQALVEGRKQRDIYNRLREDIDRSRSAYDRRVSPKVSEDFFYAEMISVLGEGDPNRLGANCPGPRGSV